MQEYLKQLKTIQDRGTLQGNRTNYAATTFPGTMMHFDMDSGFPMLTTKQMKPGKFDEAGEYINAGFVGETLGHLRALDNAADFRALGCNVWNANANDPNIDPETKLPRNVWFNSPYRKGEDDLGRIYGVQWRKRRDMKIASSIEMRHYLEDPANTQGQPYTARGPLQPTGTNVLMTREFDQVGDILRRIKSNPTDRRMIIDGWNPAEFDEMALPPCHVKYQFLVNVAKQELNVVMYQRSCDYFLGVPWNIAMSAMMLHLFAKASNLKPKYVTMMMADSHLYENSMDAVGEQLEREPFDLCEIKFSEHAERGFTAFNAGKDIDIFQWISPEDITFTDYKHHAPITGVKMAV